MSIFKRTAKKVQENAETRDGGEISCASAIYGGERRMKDIKAMQLSAVYACVELISSSIALMDINVKHIGTRERISEVRLRKLFYNGDISKFNLIHNMVSDLLINGNGYAKIERSADGLPVSLRYIPAGNITVIYKDKTYTDVLYYQYSLGGKKIYPQDMIHIYKSALYHGRSGLSILTDAKRSIDLADSAEDSALDFFSSGLNINAIIHATHDLSQHQGEQAVKSMNGSFGMNTRSKSGVFKFLPFDLKLEPLTNTLKDSQLLETRQYNISDIARFFNIPISLLTENNQNAEAVMLQFLTFCLNPYIVLFEDELNRKLITVDDLYFDFDERAILRTDLKSTALYLKQLVDAAIISVNEGRELIGLPAKEGGDDLVKPYTDISQNKLADE